MNNLSWLIYWADAAPQLSSFVCIISALLFIIFCGCYVIGVTGCFGDEAKYEQKEYGYERLAYSESLGPRFRKVWPFCILFFIMWGGSFLVPTKDTFYLIAASEAGEQAIQTPEFTKVRVVLNKWLDDQAAPTAEQKK